MTVKNAPISLRAKAQQKHPNFPWIIDGDIDGIGRFLLERDWLDPGEQVVSVAKAGEGNMNLTLRATTDRRTFILKQARPWVEKYDHIAAPWERARYEKRFYDRVSSIPEVSQAMPRLIAADEEARCLVLEDIRDATDYSEVYGGSRLSDETLGDLAQYLGQLHGATRGNPDPKFENREMRLLNHEHIYRLPLSPDNDLELDELEPGLASEARALMSDEAYLARVHETGQRYLSKGNCLLHGDYFPGSWLRTSDGPRIIDPEFCFYGDPEFDLGVCVAHLRLSDHAFDTVTCFLDAYPESKPIDGTLLTRYAAIEVMRRVIGVAQLPIPPSSGFRAQILRASHVATLSGNTEDLWNN